MLSAVRSLEAGHPSARVIGRQHAGRFQCPPKNGSNYLVQVSGKRKVNQWLMSSVLISRSHELWRETAPERLNRPCDGERQSGAMCRSARKYWAFSGPPGAGETVGIGVNGGGLETRIQRSPYF
jgi:hypothetical protein